MVPVNMKQNDLGFDYRRFIPNVLYALVNHSPFAVFEFCKLPGNDFVGFSVVSAHRSKVYETRFRVRWARSLKKMDFHWAVASSIGKLSDAGKDP